MATVSSCYFTHANVPCGTRVAYGTVYCKSCGGLVQRFGSGDGFCIHWVKVPIELYRFMLWGEHDN